MTESTPSPTSRHSPDELIARHPVAWAAATQHPFLDGIRDGSLARQRFRRWLDADHAFLQDLLRFQAQLLEDAPEPDRPVLADGLGALEAELAWFEAQAGALGLDLEGRPHPTVRAYREHLERLGAAGYASALTGLWTLERAYLDAWTGAQPGAGDYRRFVEHWTTPEFGAYVARLGEAVALAGADEAAFLATADLEARFWEIGG